MSKLFDAGGQLLPELIPAETAVAVAKPASLLDIIAQVVMDPGVDIEKMERLLAMQERVEDNQRRQAFADAMARVHAKIPPITKLGITERSRYAKLEDIHVALQPLLAEEGFSVSFDEEAYTDKHATFVMKVWHRAGHFETKRKTLAHDKAPMGQRGPIRNATQDDGSTASYARRVLYKMHFDIVEKGEDVDGEDATPISEEQARDIETQMADLNMNKGKFLIYMQVGDVRDIVKSKANDNKIQIAFQTQREMLEKKQQQ